MPQSVYPQGAGVAALFDRTRAPESRRRRRRSGEYKFFRNYQPLRVAFSYLSPLEGQARLLSLQRTGEEIRRVYILQANPCVLFCVRVPTVCRRVIVSFGVRYSIGFRGDDDTLAS